LRAQYLVDAHSISQCNGQPFTTSHLVDAIKAIVQNSEMEVSHE
jgi:2-oxoglutarate ferredoxin oxidoreductase subunit alpha